MGCIEITQGYSKDHRPNLKQFIVELMCSNDGGIPLALTVSSGNQSDKAVFGQRVTAFAQQWNLNGILVADSTLYSATNLAQMGDLGWITRVPLTLAEAQALVSDLPAETLEASERDGYRFASVCSTYGGVNQLWVVTGHGFYQQQPVSGRIVQHYIWHFAVGINHNLKLCQ